MCNSPFTPEQSNWIVLMYGEVKSLTQLRRAFRLHFCRDRNRKVARIPNLLAAFSMAWLGIVDGKCLQAQWFDGAVDGAAYLEMLKTVVWPAVRHQATCLQYLLVSAGRRASTHQRTCHGVPALQVRRSNHLSKKRTPLAALQSRSLVPGLQYLV